MSIWDGNTKYFSGQGVMLIGKRLATGKPGGLIPVGNCSRLAIANAESLIEHHESQTGNRTVDKVLTTQLKPSLSMDMESINGRNMALALWGDRADRLGASVTGEAKNWYPGMAQPLNFMQVSSVVVSRGAQALTLYTNDSTPFDYKLNAQNGSIWFNDGSVAPVDKITTGGVAPSAITVSAGVGQPTVVTVANSAAVGDHVVFTGFAGANANLINGISFEIVAASSTQVSINVDTSGKTITLGTPLSCFEGQALTVNYSYAGSTLVNALTQTAPERWIRFEGLNTADGNNPVTIDVFRMRISPLKELSLISDDIYKYTLEGDALQDVLQTSGSQYYKIQLMQP